MFKAKIFALLALILALGSVTFSRVVSFINRGAGPFLRLVTARISLTIGPILSAERGFPLLEFRWSLTKIWTSTGTSFSYLASTTTVMIRHLGLTAALTRLRYTITEAHNTGSTRLMTWLATARHGNERRSPGSVMLLGTRPKPDPIPFAALA